MGIELVDYHDILSFDEILNLDIDNMKKIKYNAIKREVLHKLKTFAEHIEEDQLDEAEKMLSWSPAGDDMGYDNYFLSFGKRSEINDEYDLGDMIERMKECK